LKRFSRSFGTTSILESVPIARNISRQFARKGSQSSSSRKMPIKKMPRKAIPKPKMTMILLKMIRMNLESHLIRLF